MRKFYVNSRLITGGLTLIAVASACYLLFQDVLWGPWPLTAKALKCLECGELQSALVYSNRAVNCSPDFDMPYRIRAKVHEVRCEYPEAIQDYTKAISLGSNVTAVVRRGRMYEKLGEFSKAAADYCNALGSANTRFLDHSHLRNIALKRVIGPSEYGTDGHPEAISSLVNFIDEAIEREPQNSDLQACKELISHCIRQDKTGNDKIQE